MQECWPLTSFGFQNDSGRPDVSHRCKNRHPLDFLIDPLYNIYPTSSFLGARLQFEIPCGPRVFQVSSGKKQPSWLEYPETFVYSGVSSNLSWINAAHHYHHRSQMAFWTWRSWNRSSTMMSSPTAWRSEFCCYYYSTTHPLKGGLGTIIWKGREGGKGATICRIYIYILYDMYLEPVYPLFWS